MAQQTQTGLTFADLKDLANVKRDLQAAVQQMQRGMTVADFARSRQDQAGPVRK
jgi:hypothetical protein